MRAIEDASDALTEAVRLERLKSPEDYNRPFLQALFNRHLAGADRASVIMSLAYWLLAPGGDVGVVFGVL